MRYPVSMFAFARLFSGDIFRSVSCFVVVVVCCHRSLKWSMRPTGEAGKMSRTPCMKSRIFFEISWKIEAGGQFGHQIQ